MSVQSDLHNELAPKILRMIVKRVSRTGGTPRDMMVIVESVAAGIITLGAIPGMADKAVEEMANGVLKRVMELQLANQPPEGTA